MSVLKEAISLAEGLLAVIEEETARLTAGEPAGDLRPLVDSKVRLTDQFEKAVGVLKKADPAAIRASGGERVEHFSGLLEKISEASAENGKIVRRRQELTDDLLNAVLTDVRRTSGATIMRYGETGGSIPGHRSAAVSIDARL